jgi:hypothetical protein
MAGLLSHHEFVPSLEITRLMRSKDYEEALEQENETLQRPSMKRPEKGAQGR